MNRDYITHWIIGIASFCVWAWGEKAGIPQELIKYAAVVLPTVVGHALAFDPKQEGEPTPQATASTQSIQQ